MQPSREGVVGERAVRVHATDDDLGDRIGLDEIDALERSHDGALGHAERRDRRTKTHVAPALGGDAVGRAPKSGEGALAARRRGVLFRHLVAPARPAPLAGSPFGRLDAGRLHPIRQLAADRHFDPEQVEAGRREGGGLVERLVDLRLGKRRADPRPRRLAEQVEQLAPGGPVGVDAVDRDVDQPAGLGHRDLAAVGLAQELRFEGKVDRAGRHIERELLRVRRRTP